MHYQIYLEPGQTLDKVGLSDFAPGANLVQVGQGPSSKPGTMVYWPQGGKDEFGYQPERQEWVPSIANGPYPARCYWVGFWKDKTPTPANLARDKMFEGQAVKLGDGHEWNIPAAVRLPHVFQRAEDGTPYFKLRKQFEAFWEKSERFWVQVITPEVVGKSIMIDADWLDYVTEALRFNYRITPEVINRLELIDQTQALQCVLATLSWQNIETVLSIVKKKGLDVSTLRTSDSFLGVTG